ncbi:MAG: type I-U CRISPR-associated protein Cas7 [Acidobacteriota bacterium]|nr:MAG: type I-U CRISPR-associated protein Cas7 [Acidobacteriota bacterium]
MSTFNTIYSALANQPRMLIEAELQPVQGDRFQPTGFPDLGAATYKRPDGTPMLLVESAQSMANRLEAVCWDDAKDEIIEQLKGLSHVVINMSNGIKASSIIESHRLSSYYLIENTNLKNILVEKIGGALKGKLDIRKLAEALFYLDAGSVLHGVFIAKKDVFEGRARLQRLLSSFIEAEGYEIAASGGAKLDRFDPKGIANEDGTKGSEEGRGNVIYSRTEFTSKRTVAYFNLDLATLRGYGLGEAAEKLLTALALFKILRLIEMGLRLRTACDFDVKSIRATRPVGIDLSKRDELLTEVNQLLPSLIAECGFGDQPLTLNGK